MSRIVQVTRPEVTDAELKRVHRTHPNAQVRKRALILLLAREGKLKKDIAAYLKVVRNTVTNVIKRFNAEGLTGIENAPRSGRPSRLTPDIDERLLKALGQSPQEQGLKTEVWTVSLVRDYLKRVGVTFADRKGLIYHLNRLGVKLVDARTLPRTNKKGPDPGDRVPQALTDPSCPSPQKETQNAFLAPDQDKKKKEPQLGSKEKGRTSFDPIETDQKCPKRLEEPIPVTSPGLPAVTGSGASQSGEQQPSSDAQTLVPEVGSPVTNGDHHVSEETEGFTPPETVELEQDERFPWQTETEVLDERPSQEVVLEPQEGHHDVPLADLGTYNVRVRQNIHDLEVDRRMTIICKTCGQPNCPVTAPNIHKTAQGACVIKPEGLPHELFPYQYVTKRVINEVGRLVHREAMSYERVQSFLRNHHNLQVHVTTVGRWVKLYQAWRQAADDMLTPYYIQGLQTLPYVVWQVDGTKGDAYHETIRIIEPVTGLHLASQAVEVRHGGRQAAIMEALNRALERFGPPGLLCRDGDEAIDAAYKVVLPGVPIQTCILHVFDNVGDKLFADVKKTFKDLLRRSKYQDRLREITKKLPFSSEDPPPPYETELLHIIDLLRYTPPTRKDHQTPLLAKIDLFKKAATFLHKRMKTLRGQLPSLGPVSPKLRQFRHSKTRCPDPIKQNWVASPVIQDGIWTWALVEVTKLVQEITCDPVFKGLPSKLSQLQREFERLQSIFYGAWLESASSLPSRPLSDTSSATWAYQGLQCHQKRFQEKLDAIAQRTNWWAQGKRRPEESIAAYALRRLEALLKLWEEDYVGYRPISETIKLIRNQEDYLFTFCQYPGTPFHQQPIEADNNAIKRPLRQRSGQLQFGVRLLEQEPVLSQLANFEGRNYNQTPAARLGIKQDQITQVLQQIDWATVQQYRAQQRSRRSLIRLRHRVYQENFEAVFKDGEEAWLDYLIELTEEYLAHPLPLDFYSDQNSLQERPNTPLETLSDV